MKAIVALWASLFSFILIDLNLLRKLRLSHNSSSNLSFEVNDHKKKNKRKRRKRNKRKYKKRKTYVQKCFKFKGTHSKDIRYKNHRKLRRMYRND